MQTFYLSFFARAFLYFSFSLSVAFIILLIWFFCVRYFIFLKLLPISSRFMATTILRFDASPVYSCQNIYFYIYFLLSFFFLPGFYSYLVILFWSNFYFLLTFKTNFSSYCNHNNFFFGHITCVNVILLYFCWLEFGFR